MVNVPLSSRCHKTAVRVKTAVACGRMFAWRNEVETCSDRCKAELLRRSEQ